MRKNAAGNSLPFGFYDLNGQLLSGQAFDGAGETTVWNSTSGTFGDTVADAVEVDDTGMYYVPLSAAELNHDVCVIVRLRKSPYADQFLVVPIDPVDVIFNDPNHVMDLFVYNATTGFLESCRKRVFASAAAAAAATTDAADDADGEIARFVMTAVDNGTGKLQPSRMQWTRAL